MANPTTVVVVFTVALSTAAAMSGGGAAAADTVHVQNHHATSGTVTSVNGTSVTGTCGTAGSPGDFGVMAQNTGYTVDVGVPSTTFKEHRVSEPTFADVCVGDQARALGSVSTDDIVTATEVIVVPPPLQKVSGTVTSVDGAGVAGTCGTAGSPGDFGVVSQNTGYTVDVGVPSTTFKEHGVSEPTFADVCMGDQARALGSVSNDVVTATEVIVVPPSPQRASGTVTSVNGAGGAGACGTAGSPGEFVLSSKGTPFTVDVAVPSTTFVDRGVSAPSFADVCVGDRTRALGAISNEVVTATEVIVVPARPRTVSGTVTSVNGTAAGGGCGTSDAPGDFVLRAKGATFVVDVGATSTRFQEKGVSAATFADVCVGDQARSLGTVSNDVVTAAEVVVVPPRPQKVSGTVTSVNGKSRCGKAGMAGAFTLTSHDVVYTVDVGDPSTTFEERGVKAPSFALVCAGDKVRASGTVSNNDVVTASDVLVTVPSR